MFTTHTTNTNSNIITEAHTMTKPGLENGFKKT